MLYRFNDYLLDTARFQLLRKSRQIKVEPQVLRLLVHLIENRNRVVPRSELYTQLWGTRVVTDNALSARVKSARRAVGDTGLSQSTIQTVHGAGYRFVADVEISSHHSTRAGSKPAGADLDTCADNRHEHGEPSLAAKAQPSIVVLPFESIGADESSIVIARGLIHDVITRIARSRMMFIIARGTAFKFESGQHDVRTIGKKLGVRYVVQGAVQISGKKLKVSVALANSLTRQEIWSWQYDRKLDDFMLVQEEIADMIVGALEAEVQREEVHRSLLMPSSNLDAWSAYHRGLHHMYSFKPDNCDKAERFFRSSIDMEPNVPRPYAGLSFLSFQRVFLNFDRNRSGGIRKAFDYAVQSLTVDPDRKSVV